MAAEQSATYDLVVLGGGSAGYAAALRAAQLDLRVVIVESDKLGGTCLHRGCIPTKAMLHTGHIADQVRGSERFGVHAQLQSIDAAGMHAHKDAVIGQLYKGLQGLINAQRIEVITGRGTLTSPTTVAVEGQEVTGRHVLIATGAAPRTLPGTPDSPRVVTSEEAVQMPEIPESVIVVGGGVIGVEFASLWASLGAQVTIVEALPWLLATEEEFLGKGLARALRKRGVQIHTGATITSIEADDDAAHVTLEGGTTLQAQVLLQSIGRAPVTGGLGLAEAGIELDEGFVQVDDHLRTTAAGVYAGGDVVRGLQLAHRGFAHGIAVAEHIAGLDPAPVRDETVPRVTYSDPEVASVGLTEAQAREQYGDAVQTITYDMAGNGRTQIQGGRGSAKLVRQADGPIVGAHLIGPAVGELIGEAQLMVGWQAYPEDVAPLVHAHPTQNEALGEAALALAGRPLHSHH